MSSYLIGPHCFTITLWSLTLVLFIVFNWCITLLVPHIVSHLFPGNYSKLIVKSSRCGDTFMRVVEDGWGCLRLFPEVALIDLIYFLSHMFYNNIVPLKDFCLRLLQLLNCFLWIQFLSDTNSGKCGCWIFAHSAFIASDLCCLHKATESVWATSSCLIWAAALTSLHLMYCRGPVTL